MQVVALRSRVVSSTTNRQCRRRSRTQSIFCRRNRDSTFCGTWCTRSSCWGLFLCYIRYISLSFSFDGVPFFGALSLFLDLPFLQKSAPALRRNCPLLRQSLYRACVFAPFCSQKKAAQIISLATKKAILLTVSYFCCIITVQICHRV